MRRALDLGPESFYLLGHSWGGILAIEYALAHPQRLEGLIVSNMMASIPAYNEYARTMLMPAMDQAVLAEIQAFEAAGDTTNPRYMELLMEHHYVHHVLRRPADEWPEDAVLGFDRINPQIYVPMQGPSELGASGKLLLGTAPPTSTAFQSPPSSSAPPTTPWTRATWSGWPTSSPKAATWLCPTAATWRCTTTRSGTSRA